MTGDEIKGNHFWQDRLLGMRGNINRRAGARHNLLCCRWNTALYKIRGPRHVAWNLGGKGNTACTDWKEGAQQSVQPVRQAGRHNFPDQRRDQPSSLQDHKDRPWKCRKAGSLRFPWALPGRRCLEVRLLSEWQKDADRRRHAERLRLKLPLRDPFALLLQHRSCSCSATAPSTWSIIRPVAVSVTRFIPRTRRLAPFLYLIYDVYEVAHRPGEPMELRTHEHVTLPKVVNCRRGCSRSGDAADLVGEYLLQPAAFRSRC
mgnify:CR=1 FL=1